jgi:hypothetical protein
MSRRNLLLLILFEKISKKFYENYCKKAKNIL